MWLSNWCDRPTDVTVQLMWPSIDVTVQSEEKGNICLLTLMELIYIKLQVIVF